MNKNQDKRKKISSVMRKQLLVLRARGWIQAKLARKFKCSQSTVSRILRQSKSQADETKEEGNES